MKLFNFTIAVILTCCTHAMAQKNLKPAYVVTLKGDTIRGFIDSRKWDGNPGHAKLMATNNIVVELTKNNTQYFEVSGSKAFQRYAGPITLDNISDQVVLNGRDTNMRMDTVFLKVIEKGERLSLYSFSDATKTRFYITEKNGEMPVELGYRVYYDSGHVNVYQGVGRTVNEDTYVKQLYDIALKYDLMNDDLQRKMEWLRYAKGYILEIVEKINGTDKTLFH